MKGICFKEELFNKTIEGSKTQTRRIITCPKNADGGLESHSLIDGTIIRIVALDEEGLWTKKDGSDWIVKPKYEIGETIYLKEPYYKIESGTIQYKYQPSFFLEGCVEPNWKWKNKLFMPANAARYFIKITSVRAERLQNISDEDCIEEGIVFDGSVYMNKIDKIQYLEPRAAYRTLINSINGKNTWESNPFVWVYDYELTTKPQDHE